MSPFRGFPNNIAPFEGASSNHPLCGWSVISKIKPPGQVLDLGYGIGYHATAFAQKGFQVFAFDPGDKYLEIAQNHISTAGVNVNHRLMICSDLDESEYFALPDNQTLCARYQGKIAGHPGR